MKYNFLLFAIALFLSNNCEAQTSLINDTMYVRCTQTLDFAFEQANRMTKSLSGTQLPNCLNANGSLVLVNANNWTSGFFSGELWYLSNYKNDAAMQANAKKYTQLLVNQQYATNTHDLGFEMYCSYGNGLQFANVAGYKDILIQTAYSLQTRYNATVGCMRSWDNAAYTYPVIIDNMMNLELMLWATRATGDSLFYKGAVSHALNTMTNHYRPDYSSFHLVDYNPYTGAVIGKQTVQGYSNSSSWARGQAWGLYGFTMLYNETKMPAFLNQAKHIADYIIKSLPTDYVFYYDYSDPAIPYVPRDASASAITASALLELYRITNDVYFMKIAEKIIWHLSSPQYMNTANENQNFLLKHSTGSKPSNSQVDVPLIYADYYFVEALCRYVKLKNTIAGLPLVKDAENKIEVYPNPFINQFSISSNSSFDKIELTDITGKILFSERINSSNIHTFTNSKAINKGIYLLKIYFQNNLIATEKLLN